VNGGLEELLGGRDGERAREIKPSKWRTAAEWSSEGENPKDELGEKVVCGVGVIAIFTTSVVRCEGRMQRDIDIGGLGVGGEPLLEGRAGSTKPLCSQPSSRGGEGDRSWGNSHRASTASSGRAGGPSLILLPSGIDSYVGERRIMTRGRQPRCGTILGWRNPLNPQLEQRRGCRLPPAGGGGWDRFLLTRSVEQGHNLSVS
jgi:hypothetical protein